MAKYPHFARKTRFGPSRMRPHTSKMSAKGYHTFDKVGRVRMGPKPDEDVERNDYHPKFGVVASNMRTGSVKMDSQINRSFMPQGRPQEYQMNLVQSYPDYSGTVDAKQLTRGYKSLGHLRTFRPTIDFGQTKGRDLSFYMQNEMVRNVLRDNEKFDSEQGLAEDAETLPNTSQYLSNTQSTHFFKAPAVRSRPKTGNAQVRQ